MTGIPAAEIIVERSYGGRRTARILCPVLQPRQSAGRATAPPPRAAAAELWPASKSRIAVPLPT